MFVNGAGVLLPGVESLEELDRVLEGEIRNEGWQVRKDIPLETKLKNRRIDSFIRMAMYCCEKAVKAGRREQDAYETGTVFHSVFGPEDSVVEFSKSIIKKDYEGCSPITFSNTVFNSALGNVCLNLGLKGNSVAMMCSRYMEHAQRQLELGKIKSCLVCALENINEKKHDVLEKSGISMGEGAAALWLETEKAEHTLGEIAACESCYIGEEAESGQFLEAWVQKFLERNGIHPKEIGILLESRRFPMENGGNLTEQFAVESKDCIDIEKILGNRLGASLAVNILAALRLLELRGEKLAFGMEPDYYGNVTCYVVRR